MNQRTRSAWRDLLSAEAPASLAPPLFSARGRRRSTRLPIPVWQRARGAWVWDTEGRRYLDFVAGFGVASLGHSHPRVVDAVRRQALLLMHGYGDVHPHELRARLARRLARLGPWPTTRVLWAQNGSEAVELAWKTATLATGRPGVLAFEGGYHGESVGALSLTGWPEFRAPFEALLPRRAIWAPFAHGPDHAADGGSSCDLSCVDEAFARADRFHARGPGVGAVLIEPIQGRGGVIVPPPGYLEAIERQARRRGWLLIVDEVFTGLGRTGKRFAFEHEGIRPDLICIGKSLAGGLPLAAVLGRASVLRAWRRAVAGGEAPHSSTFLAHPLACAAALAALDVLEQHRLAARAARLGRRLQARLSEVLGSRPGVSGARGRGLLVGFDISRGPGGRPDPRAARAVVEAALGERLLVLTAGQRGNVISLSPSLTIDERLLFDGIDRLARALRKALDWG